MTKDDSLRDDHFAKRLNKLFKRRLREDGKPYSHQDVAEGTGISPSTISRLRSGKESNPTFQTIYQICRFFNVPVSYFDPEVRGVIEKREEAILNHVKHRSIGLNDDEKEVVTGMLEHILKLKEAMRKPESEEDS